MAEPKKTQLNALHRELGGKMVEFAGYDMPVQYPSGVLREHLHPRAACGLFDVSHMGQGAILGAGAAAAFEALVPGAIQELKPGQTRYTLLLNDKGGIRDDLMVTRPAGDTDFSALLVVVNAGCKDADFAHIAAGLGPRFAVERYEDRPPSRPPLGGRAPRRPPAARPRGPAGGGGPPPPLPGSGGDEVHDRRPAQGHGPRLHARALGLYRRGRL